MANAIKARSFDFSDVKDRSQYNPKQLAEGDYLATITSVEETESKAGDDMWVFGITPDDHRSITYPYYCNLEQANQLWKLRNLFISAGQPIGKSAAKLNPSKVIGKQIGISLEDDEYEGKMKSVVNSVMQKSELADYAEVVSDDDDDEDDFEEEEAPKPKARKKAKPAPEPEEDDEEEEVEEEAPKVSKRTAARRAAKAEAEAKAAAEDDDDDEEEVEVKPKRKAKAAPVVEEDDDDDLELDLDED